MSKIAVSNAEKKFDERSVPWIRASMVKGEYGKVANLGRKAWNEFIDILLYSVTFAELSAYYGLALVYTGKTEEGIAVFQIIIKRIEQGRVTSIVAEQNSQTDEGKRWNWVLGRTYNNWAYAEWVNHGNYKRAIELFKSALPYFIASEFLEELANIWDNMGRVHSLLGNHALAHQLTDDAFELRKELHNDYRIALSYISQATVRLAAGEPHTARGFAEEALAICEKEKKTRGVGLAHIILGRVLYDLGQLSTTPAVQEWFFECSLSHLEQAVSIFETEIKEPVRLAEALYEITRVCMSYVQMLRRKNYPLKSRIVTSKALSNFTKVYRIVRKFGFSVLKDKLDQIDLSPDCMANRVRSDTREEEICLLDSSRLEKRHSFTDKAPNVLAQDTIPTFHRCGFQSI